MYPLLLRYLYIRILYVYMYALIDVAFCNLVLQACFSYAQLVSVQTSMMLAGGFFSFALSVRKFKYARPRCWREIFSFFFFFFFSFSFLPSFSFHERQLVNLQAPMVLAGDLNLSVPFATATSLGSPCKGGLCVQRLCMRVYVCVCERERERERDSAREREIERAREREDCLKSLRSFAALEIKNNMKISKL
jgi:hypothetical protein